MHLYGRFCFMSSGPKISIAWKISLAWWCDPLSLLASMRALAAILIAVMLCLPLAQKASAQGSPDYKLGPQDKVRLLVYEWRTTLNTVFEWTSLNAEFTVGAAGAVSLPILGEIPAAGSTTSELARTIGEALTSRIGLSEAPKVAVEVVLYRPFYIAGAVNRPGEFPYRPELTVLQAVSIAGGMIGSGDSAMRLNREIITTLGDSQSTEAEATGLFARKARLEAELRSADKIAFPPELERRKDDPAVATVMRQEIVIFEARRNALKTEIDALAQLKVFLAKGVESLQAQTKAQERERDLTKKELENVASLVSRGLAASPRQLELERVMSRMEGERLRMEGEVLRTQQDISRADLAIIEARNRLSNETAASLRETQTRLEQAVVRMATADRLLYDSRVTYPNMLSARQKPDSKLKPTYRIVRRVGGQIKEMTVSENAGVEAGDTLTVEMPVPEAVSTTGGPLPQPQVRNSASQ
jgi:polysaccharide biosynthesis/export protein